MNRRSLLAALAASVPLTGCQAIRGLSGSSSSIAFSVCGPASPTACSEIDLDPTFSEQSEVFVSEAYADEKAMVQRPTADRVSIIGETQGIGDPDCRSTTLRSHSVSNETLDIKIANTVDPPLFGSCFQSREAVYYHLRVDELPESVESLRLRHYSRETVVLDQHIPL